ncbi:tetratricopeptide repeat protein [Desulfuromonas acetoxidans]|uniref:tetratricopeptide repeat protein n=1 Tax=Desulfuromonas acetoxidans TaxID=891 RepID=UPI00138A17C5|nr:tetratricopeptide repeat protein [Desulfuromonas acetoxidans]MBF0646648.1 tetratricopeptide repeat protein [Desulfuromonas acetoxidans]NVD26093.1 tetratricopeptide repeat protein [Desulfuromonas acetoxidans]NVE16917.1 tetratricopeptide repeat protein [Desulfuromonas acetoxidans]
MTLFSPTQDTIHRWLAGAVLLLMLVCGLATSADAKLTFRQNKHLYQAQKALQVGDAQQCVTMIHSYTTEYPDDIPYPFYSLLGACYHQLNDYPKAAEAFATALKLQPDDAQLSINLATCYYLDGHYDQAGRQFSHSYQLQQAKDPQLLYQSAVAFIQGEHYRQAKQSLTSLINSGATIKANWYELLLSCHIELKEWQQGQQLLDRLLQQQPEHEPYWRLKAQIALQQEKYKQAASALEVTLRLHGDNRDDLTQLAGLYGYLRAPLRAADLLKRAYQDTPTPENSLKIARLYHQGYAYDEALAEVDAALHRSPKNSELHSLKAQLLYDRGSYQQLLALSPTTARPRQHLLQGYAAWHLGQWETARTHFKQALGDRRFRSQARNALDVLDLLAQAEQESNAAI